MQLSRKFSDTNRDFQRERIAPTEIDHQETQYENEIKEENYSKKREEEKEIQEDVQQKSKYPPRNEKPCLSRRTWKSSHVQPNKASFFGRAEKLKHTIHPKHTSYSSSIDHTKLDSYNEPSEGYLTFSTSDSPKISLHASKCNHTLKVIYHLFNHSTLN